MKGIQLTWESYKLEQFVQKFSELVLVFQEKVEDLIRFTKQIEVEVKSLETCAYSRATFAEVIEKVQRQVDELTLKQFSNVPFWVARVDEAIELRLVRRLDAAISLWTRALRARAGMGADETASGGGSEHAPIDFSALGGVEPCLPEQRHELLLQNQLITLQPPIDYARSTLYRALFDWQNVVLSLPRVQSSRYQQTVAAVAAVGYMEAGEEENPKERTYRNLLSKLPSARVAFAPTPISGSGPGSLGSGPEQSDARGPALSGPVLELAYKTIEWIVERAREYVKTWTSYQALWDLQPEVLYERLGSSLRRWINVLDDIKQMRRHFDTSDSQHEFGPVVVGFARVQGKVSMKYDAWHKDVLARFAALLNQEFCQFHTSISKVHFAAQKTGGPHWGSHHAHLTNIERFCEKGATCFPPTVQLHYSNCIAHNLLTLIPSEIYLHERIMIIFALCIVVFS